MSEKVLLHVCCATCAIGAFDTLREECFEVKGFFHNPNIHPLIEFRRRLKAVDSLDYQPRRTNAAYLCPHLVEAVGQVCYLRLAGR